MNIGKGKRPDIYQVGKQSYNFPGTNFLATISKNGEQNNDAINKRNQKTTGLVEFQVIDPKLSKILIDEIDRVLARHYGFTDEEIDYIINYDVKYRIGSNVDSSAEQL